MEKKFVQLTFNDIENPHTVYIIPATKVIYPEYKGRKVVRKPFAAERLNEQIEGEQGYTSRERIHVYIDTRYRTLPVGTRFGATPEGIRQSTIGKKGRRL